MSQPEGYCAVAVVGDGRRDWHWERFRLFSIVGTVAAINAHKRGIRKVPAYWPETAYFALSRAAKDLALAAEPAEGERSGPLPGRSSLKRASGFASVLAQIVGMESFILTVTKDRNPVEIHEVAMHRQDHDGARHVLIKAHRLFHELPAYEHEFVWSDVRSGMLLTPKEREGIAPGRTIEGIINADSHFAHTGALNETGRRGFIPPSPVAQKAEVDDPGLMAALERWRAAAGFAAVGA